MVFNDLLIFEVLITAVVIFYVTNTNLLVLLYSGGLYLLLLGFLLFLNDADIYTGFLWVIDLGVGLVFFIFILHFTSFLYQKSQFNLSARYFYLIVNFFIFLYLWVYYVNFNNDGTASRDLGKSWFFRVTYADYYSLFNVKEVSELNLLKDSYFLLNSFEFFIVNFSLLFGLLGSILMCFMIHRIFNFLNFSQIINMNILSSTDTNFFIRSQNFITQQGTSGAVAVWAKSKSTRMS